MAKQLAQVIPTAVAALQEQSTKDSDSLADEIQRKKHFLQVFRRWEALFKRADRGDVEAEKWLIADYFKSLGHLSPEGLEALTDELKARCTFFPTIKECLEIMNPPRFQYSSKFYGMKHLGEQAFLAAPEKPNHRLVTQIEAERLLSSEAD